MKSRAHRLAVLLLLFVLLVARQVRAEMWCGDGPGTHLSHPCTDDDDSAAVADAIEKYSDQWTKLDGVWGVTPGSPYHNRAEGIDVHVDPPSVDAAKKRIPSSVEGIPVVIVPGEMPSDGGGYFYSFPRDPAEAARHIQREKDRGKREMVCNAIVQKFSERWNDLPGVIGIGSGKCDDGGCDFTRIEVSVQSQHLPAARKKIPEFVDGVPIVLVPEK